MPRKATKGRPDLGEVPNGGLALEDVHDRRKLTTPSPAPSRDTVLKLDLVKDRTALVQFLVKITATGVRRRTELEGQEELTNEG